jgi:hypothetical protein
MHTGQVSPPLLFGFAAMASCMHEINGHFPVTDVQYDAL